jgi:hypothetical protein
VAARIPTPPAALDEESAGRRRARRRRQLDGLAGGVVLGALAGLGLAHAFGISGPAAIGLGVPLALAIVFGVFGLILGTVGEVEVVDAPVRAGRYRRLGRAAASERGQLPGSPVPPRAPDDRKG